MPITSSTPRVLYCTDTYPPQLNGVSVVTQLSVDGLRRRGWDVRVIMPRYPLEESDVFTESGGASSETVTIPSIALPMYQDIRLAAPRQAIVHRVVASFRPELVHCATEFMIGRMGQRAAARQGIPTLSSYHTDFSRYTASYGVPWLRAPVRNYLGRFHQRSRRVYTPGHLAREELRALGVGEVEVWGRGVDIDLFHPRHGDDAVRRAHAPDNALLFLHVGRLAPEKGVDRLVRAFAVARWRLMPERDIRLVIAGRGPREAQLRASAPPGVTFLGNLERREALPTLYASADAFLFASVTETLGLVILEAMASGLPVIAAPAGGVADHLRDGINGVTYPPNDVERMADAIVALARDEERRRALGAGARATATALSWEAELDRLDASYRELRERFPVAA